MVYRLKPEWLNDNYYLFEEGYLTACSYYIDDVWIDWVTPLGLAILKRNKKLENLLIRLGADVEKVVSLKYDDSSFDELSAEELRDLMNQRK